MSSTSRRLQWWTRSRVTTAGTTAGLGAVVVGAAVQFGTGWALIIGGLAGVAVSEWSDR